MPKATMNLLVNEEIKNKKINMAEFQYIAYFYCQLILSIQGSSKHDRNTDPGLQSYEDLFQHGDIDQLLLKEIEGPTTLNVEIVVSIAV